MRTIVYDTEFIEDGSTIDLISIGMVDDIGGEYYAISTEFDASKASDWVRDNVLTKLPPITDSAWKPREQIMREVYSYLIRTHDDVQLWADYGAYDHVVLAQLFGTMMDLPDGVPMFTHELQQLWEDAGRPAKPGQTDEHDALADARYGMALWRTCKQAVS